MNPWRFFGMAMYAESSRRMQGRELVAKLSDGRITVVPLEKLPEGARLKIVRVLQAFLSKHLTWGTLYTPEPQSAVLFDLMPAAVELYLSADEYILNEHQLVTSRTLVYRCMKAPLDCHESSLTLAEVMGMPIDTFRDGVRFEDPRGAAHP